MHRSFVSPSGSANTTVFVTFATSLEGGAVAACLVLKALLPYMMDVARGYPYYPSAEDPAEGLPFAKEVLLSSVWAEYIKPQ